MQRHINTQLALVAIFALASAGADAALMPVLHSTMDNVDVGAGLGTDDTRVATFAVRDTAGTAEDGIAEDVLNNTTTSSAYVLSGFAGQIGQALQFSADEAQNRGVDYGDVHDIGGGDYTASIWFNVADSGELQTIAAKGNSSSASEGWHIFVEGGNVITRLGLGTSAEADKAAMNESVTADVWHHVALVVSNSLGTVAGYLDGALMSNIGGGGAGDASFTPNTDISNSDRLSLAIRSDGQLEFERALDDFAIFDRALSAEQIGKIYDGGLGGRNAVQALVPEPATAALLALAGVGLAGGLNRRRRVCAG